MGNSIFTIFVTRENGVWAFDDAARDLQREALVAGIPEMIVAVAARKNIPHPEDGVSLVFSKTPFPGHDVKLERQPGGDEEQGNYYTMNGMTGWLCPALYKFFDKAPDCIYVSVMPAR